MIETDSRRATPLGRAAGFARQGWRQGWALVLPLLRPAFGEDPPPPVTKSGGWFRRTARHAGPVLSWLIALVLFLTSIALVTDTGGPLPVALGAAVLYALPVGLSSRRPLLAWRIVLIAAIVGPLIVRADVPDIAWPVPQILGAIVVLFAVGRRHTPRVLGPVWALTVVSVAWAALVAGGGTEEAVPVFVLLLTAPLAAGYLIGARRRSDARREEEEARSAILEERARIARELHDVVAHHMSVIAVQAETAPFRIDDLSDEGRACLAEISGTAREALTEMRRLLGVLRSEDAEAETAPQPGLHELEPLLDGARRAGLSVECVSTGTPPQIPPGVSMSAYRIIQEALSNALRHAPGAPVLVELTYEPGGIRLTVTNGEPAAAGPAPMARPEGRGHGLLGMRERVSMLGGQLTAEPTPVGGFVVAATLPLADSDPQL